MNLSPLLRNRYFDVNGLPLAGGQLFTYAAGTTTPQVTYLNETGTTNTNPVVLDSGGYADVWLDPTLAYKFLLEDVSGNLQWTVDNVTFPLGVTTWSTNTNYAQGQVVADSSGFGILYVSLISNNQGNALTSTSDWRVLNGNTRTVSTSSSLAITDNFIRSNSTSGNLTHTLPACATTPIGKQITIKDVGTGGNATTVQGAGSDLVDGNNIYAFKLGQYASLAFTNNGTSWDVGLSLPNGSVTQAILGARATNSSGGTVPVGAIAISSANSASFSTTSATAVAITPLTVTLKTTGRPVYLALIAAQAGAGFVQANGAGGASILFLNGSTVVNTLKFGDTAGDIVTLPGSAFSTLDMAVNGTPGTYTYSVSGLISGGSTLSVSTLYLIAYEI